MDKMIVKNVTEKVSIKFTETLRVNASFTLGFDDKTGKLSLLGKDGAVLSEIDLPIEKILTKAYYDDNSKELVLNFENSNEVRIPIDFTDEIESAIKEFESRVNTQFSQLQESVNTSFQEVNQKIDDLEKEINTNINSQVETLNQKVDTLEDTINNNIGKQVEALNESINETNQDLQDYKESNAQSLSDLETNLEQKIVENVEQINSDIEEINNNKVDKVDGKQLSTIDLTNELLALLQDKYTKEEINGLDSALQQQIDEIKLILTTDDVDFDTLQELVNALKNNVASINDIFTELSKKANKQDVPTKLSQLKNDNFYIQSEVIEENPTTSKGGKWRFKIMPLNNGISAESFNNIEFNDNLGNNYTTLRYTAGDFYKSYYIIIGISNGNEILLYSTNGKGLAFENEDFYLVFDSNILGGTNDGVAGALKYYADKYVEVNYAKKEDLFSRSYNDLKDKPTIPSKTSQLTNDSSFVSQTEINKLNEKINNIKPDAIIDVSSVDEIGTNEKVLYRVSSWQGTVVPNEGYVENVYFNTNLSVDEVVAILSKLETNENNAGFILASEDYSIIIGFMYLEGTYGILNAATDEFYFISNDLGWGFVGWNTAISYPLIINNNVVNSFQMEGNNFVSGTQNNLLTKLFSITPFIETTPKLYHLKNGDKYELVSKDELDKTIGDINSILDTLNGEVV